VSSIPKQVDVVESEKALLASILSDPSIMHEVYTDLRAKHFYKQEHRYIWRAMEACIEDGHDPDQLDVLSKLGEHGFDDKIDADELNDLHTDIPDASKARHHADVVREFYKRRLLQSTCSEVSSRLENYEMGYDEARKYVDDQMRPAESDGGGDHIGELAVDVEKHIERIEKGEEEAYFPTTIEVVDDVLGGGLKPGRFYMIAARPKHGKTSLAVAIICELILNHDFAVDFWYTDGQSRDIGVAVLSYLAKVSNTDIANGELDADEMHWLSKAQAKVQDWNMQVHAKGSPDPRDIRLQARSRSAAHDRYLVCVDYLQQCDAGHTGSNAGRLNAEAASRMMADIRTDFGCLALGLAQFNRGADDQALPHYSYLKSSGQFEQDVNELLVWNRPDFSKNDEEAEGEGTTLMDERYGVLNHQLSKHKPAGMAGEHMREVDARLGMNTFQPWDPSEVQRQVDYGYPD